MSDLIRGICQFLGEPSNFISIEAPKSRKEQREEQLDVFSLRRQVQNAGKVAADHRDFVRHMDQLADPPAYQPSRSEQGGLPSLDLPPSYQDTVKSGARASYPEHEIERQAESLAGFNLSSVARRKNAEKICQAVLKNIDSHPKLVVSATTLHARLQRAQELAWGLTSPDELPGLEHMDYSCCRNAVDAALEPLHRYKTRLEGDGRELENFSRFHQRFELMSEHFWDFVDTEYHADIVQLFNGSSV